MELPWPSTHARVCIHVYICVFKSYQQVPRYRTPILIGRPIHSALCHTEAKSFVNYYQDIEHLKIDSWKINPNKCWGNFRWYSLFLVNSSCFSNIILRGDGQSGFFSFLSLSFPPLRHIQMGNPSLFILRNLVIKPDSVYSVLNRHWW